MCTKLGFHVLSADGLETFVTEGELLQSDRLTYVLRFGYSGIFREGFRIKIIMAFPLNSIYKTKPFKLNFVYVILPPTFCNLLQFKRKNFLRSQVNS